MDILANYYKSAIFSIRTLINQPNSNNAKTAKNKMDRLYKEVLILRFSMEKNDDEFEMFKKKAIELINEISKWD